MQPKQPRQPGIGKEKLPIPAAPSLSAAKLIFKRVLVDGILTWSSNFKRRCKLRSSTPGFNTVDAANVIRRAKIVHEPRFNEAYYAWEYDLCDLVDGRKVMVVVLLHCECDYQQSPRVTVKTVARLRGRARELTEKETEDDEAR